MISESRHPLSPSALLIHILWQPTDLSQFLAHQESLVGGGRQLWHSDVEGNQHVEHVSSGGGHIY